MARLLSRAMHPSNRPLGDTMLRTAGIAQALVALPCALYLTGSAWNYFSHCYDLWYLFTSRVVFATMAYSIVYIAVVQQRTGTTSYQAFVLEAIKANVATLLFVWVNTEYYWNLKRLIVTLLAVLVMFDVPLGYAYAAWKEDKREGRVGGEDETLPVNSKTPLLQGGMVAGL